MSLKLREAHRIFVFEEYIDLRGGFDRLSMIIRDKMGAELLSGDLFLFLGKSRKKLKAICYDGTGMVLIAKRLERGRFMSLLEMDQMEITEEEFQLFFKGSVIRRKYFGQDALTKTHEQSILK